MTINIVAATAASAAPTIFLRVGSLSPGIGFPSTLRIAPLLRTHKIEPAELKDRIDPAEATLRIDPEELTDRIDPADAIDRTLAVEASDRADQLDPTERLDRYDTCDRNDLKASNVSSYGSSAAPSGNEASRGRPGR